jgi:arylsulfatase A-like enzyme
VSERESEAGPTGLSWSTIACATLGCALFVGLLDLTLALDADHGGAAPLATYFAPAAASAACAALAFAVCAIAARAARLVAGAVLASALTLGAFAAVASVPVWLCFLRHFGLSPGGIALPRVLAVAAGTGVAVALLAARANLQVNQRALRAVAVALAWIAAVAGVRCSFGALERLPLPAWMAGFVVFGVAVVWRRGERLAARAPLWIGGLTLATGSMLALVAMRGEPEHVAPPPASAPQPRGVKRILLVVIDTLRADHLSCFDPQARATPSTDSLARDSIVFEQARSCAPWTLPSMTSILSGVPPEVHQVLSVRASPSSKLPSLAQVLHDAGYRTGAIGTNTVLRPQSRLDRGFDDYQFHPSLRGATPIGSQLLKRAGRNGDAHEGDAAELTDAAIGWLSAHEHDDTFLWLHYYDPHFPYASPEVPPDPLVARGKNGFSPLEVRAGILNCDLEQRAAVLEAYGDEVAHFDRHFGRLLAFLRERGWYDDTLIVLTADHGEEFWEHDGVEHGQSVYDELVRIPLLVKPSGPPAPARCANAVSNIAIGSTLLALCGLDPAAHGFAEPALIARAGSAWKCGEPPPATFSSGTMFYENRTAITFDHFKYIRLSISGREELFNLAQDPGETNSRHAANRAEIVRGRTYLEEMKRAALAQREQLGIHELDAAQIGESVLRELRGLGYVK